MNSHETQPIKTGPVIIGSMESHVMPFEDATADFAHINDYLRKNPAYRTHIIPDSIVSSCSQCCMAEINGQPNILGMLHRKAHPHCKGCTVPAAAEQLPARMSDGRFLKDHAGRILSKADAVRMAEDGTA